MAGQKTYRQDSTAAKKIAIRWSDEMLGELHRTAEKHKSDRPNTALLIEARLAAASGDYGRAENILLEALSGIGTDYLQDDGLFLDLQVTIFTTQRLDLAATLVREKYGLSCAIEIRLEQRHRPHQVTWDVRLPESMRFSVDASILQSDRTSFQISRLNAIFATAAVYASNWPGDNGSVLVNLGDDSPYAGLALCTNRADCFAIPDSEFILAKGYRRMREEIDKAARPWQERRAIAFWRGTATGSMALPVKGWRSIPRIQLCEIGHGNSDEMDVAITGVDQLKSERVRDEVRQSGLMKRPVNFTTLSRYKYQIDIDGNTNSWTGFFQRLYSGSPVLKVESVHSYRQWYYDRLRPWINYVPVASDMLDLVEKIQWLRTHDGAARLIGENGKAVAGSLDYTAEMRDSVRTIAAALRYFSNRPELEVGFGTSREGNAYLREGWGKPNQAGVPSNGFESVIELPLPRTYQDVLISIELSTNPIILGVPRRVSVIVGGEILGTFYVDQRRPVFCRLSRQAMIRRSNDADALVIKICNPDALPAASKEHPGDDHIVSVIVHSVVLMAEGIAVRMGGVGLSQQIEAAVKSYVGSLARGTHQVSGKEVGESRQFCFLKTYHKSIVFFDPVTQSLRHGSEKESPKNLLLCKAEGKASFLYMSFMGGFNNVRVAAEGGPLGDPETSGGKEQIIQIFDVMPAGANTVCVRDQTLFLCAERDGRVTLSRYSPGPWEQFTELDVAGAQELFAVRGPSGGQS